MLLLVLLSAALHATWNGLIKGGTDRYLDTAGLLLGSVVLAFVVMPFRCVYTHRACWPLRRRNNSPHRCIIAACYEKGEIGDRLPTIMRGAAPTLATSGSAAMPRTSASAFAGLTSFSFRLEWLPSRSDRRIIPPFISFPSAMAFSNAAVITLSPCCGLARRCSVVPRCVNCHVLRCSAMFMSLYPQLPLAQASVCRTYQEKVAFRD